jgi:two-component system OmpR family response regulator
MGLQMSMRDARGRTDPASLPQRFGRAGRAGTPTSAPAKLLVVDDEPNILELLAATLRFTGFEVASASDGFTALTTARDFKPDLVVLDVMMPGIDGFEVARRLRAGGNHPPVLFLSARDGADDKVAGLTVGGDDYVTKPFSLEEVVARIRAILRRTRGDETEGGANSILCVGDITLDEDTYEVFKAGQPVELSATEFKVLRYFMRNAGRVLSKTQILEHVWSYDFGGDANVVEAYVSHLRRKVDTTQPRLLHTLRGMGYALRVPKS